MLALISCQCLHPPCKTSMEPQQPALCTKFCPSCAWIPSVRTIAWLASQEKLSYAAASTTPPNLLVHSVGRTPRPPPKTTASRLKVMQTENRQTSRILIDSNLSWRSRTGDMSQACHCCLSWVTQCCSRRARKSTADSSWLMTRAPRHHWPEERMSSEISTRIWRTWWGSRRWIRPTHQESTTL